MSLRRVGGKDDGGIDLLGWWWLPSTSHGGVERRRRRFRVICQCKAEKKKAGPKYIRELEGVLHRYISYDAHTSSASNDLEKTPPGADKFPLVALFISESPFTKATLLRAQSSPVPFFLLHIPPLPRQGGEEVENEEETRIGTAIWNPALGGARGLLRGEMEVRWERSLSRNGDERPGLWWNGQKLRSWTPDSSEEGEEGLTLELSMRDQDAFFAGLAEEFSVAER